MRFRTRILGASVALAAALGGCGGGKEPVATSAASESPPSPAEPSSAVVWAVGDGGTGDAKARSVVARIVRDGPDRVLYLGDVYERGTARDFARNFEPVYAPLLDRTAPTPGNHEWRNRARGYFPFWARVRGERLPSWYAFTVAGWRIVSLNSETSTRAESSQGRWLRRELAQGSGTCRIAFFHRPRFSAGPHGDQQRVAPFWRALKGHARLVLSGHDHDLQRFRSRDGMVQIVSGAGGRELYGVDERDRRLAFSNDKVRGALRLELRPGRADLQFVSAGGRVLDRSAVRCST